MIRREPTLIPMGDFDVQDVRDMVAKQKLDAQAHQQLMVKMKRMAENSTMEEEDLEMLNHLKAANTRQDRARRLGLDDDSVEPSKS